MISQTDRAISLLSKASQSYSVALESVWILSNERGDWRTYENVIAVL